MSACEYCRRPVDRSWLAICCSTHQQLLCHACYRATHFVEVCHPACDACAREGLPVLYRRTALN